MSATQKPSCFVIAPIGPKDSDIRRRSDKVLKHIFRKALAEKYEVTRGDEIDEPGMITSQVLRAVQEAHLVVADLTGHNPNVLYELAVRHAIEKFIIHAIEPKLSKIPFDIAGFRTIEFDLTDPDSIESAVEQLTKHAEQAEKGKWGETPVKLANIMRRSEQDPEDTLLLKQAVEGIAALRTQVDRLQNSNVIVGSYDFSSGPLQSYVLNTTDFRGEATAHNASTFYGEPTQTAIGHHGPVIAPARNALRQRIDTDAKNQPPPVSQTEEKASES